jgi:hypothetical protein
MTREKALEASRLLYRIEAYESLMSEITELQTLDEIAQAYGENLQEELLAVVQPKLDALLKELKEM